MARLRAEIKRGFLRSLWRAASKAGGVTVKEMLEGFQDGGFQWIRTGRVVLSTAGGGYSSAFNPVSDTRELTEAEVFAFSEELFSVYAQVLSDNPALSPDNDGQAIIDAMLADDRMWGVREVMHDHSLLRFPNTRM